MSTINTMPKLLSQNLKNQLRNLSQKNNELKKKVKQELNKFIVKNRSTLQNLTEENITNKNVRKSVVFLGQTYTISWHHTISIEPRNKKLKEAIRKECIKIKGNKLSRLNAGNTSLIRHSCKHSSPPQARQDECKLS